jgi:hypothetical protein
LHSLESPFHRSFSKEYSSRIERRAAKDGVLFLRQGFRPR